MKKFSEVKKEYEQHIAAERQYLKNFTEFSYILKNGIIKIKENFQLKYDMLLHPYYDLNFITPTISFDIRMNNYIHKYTNEFGWIYDARSNRDGDFKALTIYNYSASQFPFLDSELSYIMDEIRNYVHHEIHILYVTEKIRFSVTEKFIQFFSDIQLFLGKDTELLFWKSNIDNEDNYDNNFYVVKLHNKIYAFWLFDDSYLSRIIYPGDYENLKKLFYFLKNDLEIYNSDWESKIMNSWKNTDTQNE